jgi:cell wall-associated NlpC family hydrolase
VFAEEGPIFHEDSVYYTAKELEGKPYKNVGSTSYGFDTSGFTQYVFKTLQLK